MRNTLIWCSVKSCQRKLFFWKYRIILLTRLHELREVATNPSASQKKPRMPPPSDLFHPWRPKDLVCHSLSRAFPRLPWMSFWSLIALFVFGLAALNWAPSRTQTFPPWPSERSRVTCRVWKKKKPPVTTCRILLQSPKVMARIITSIS